MNQREEMPEWPDPYYYTYYGKLADTLYDAARYEAAMARLNVAVEALKDIAPDATAIRRPVEWWENRALSAISLIGPLPPRPGNAGEAET